MLKVGSKGNRINDEGVRTELGILSLKQKERTKIETDGRNIPRDWNSHSRTRQDLQSIGDMGSGRKRGQDHKWARIVFIEEWCLLGCYAVKTSNLTLFFYVHSVDMGRLAQVSNECAASLLRMNTLTTMTCSPPESLSHQWGHWNGNECQRKDRAI
jgi:hypothetical protein